MATKKMSLTGGDPASLGFTRVCTEDILRSGGLLQGCRNHRQTRCAIRRSEAPRVDGETTEHAARSGKLMEWRCAGGAVLACQYGANIPCDSKAVTSQKPTQPILDYCKQNPGSDFVPMVVTGHDTTVSWACHGSTPAVIHSAQIDAQGYQTNVLAQGIAIGTPDSRLTSRLFCNLAYPSAPLSALTKPADKAIACPAIDLDALVPCLPIVCASREREPYRQPVS